jgi:NADH-quinone oxidoreductase subunit K|tara:strand:- start:171 stop:485 length:315 start_codon:yes stop_codon:yes gene_type:complete
MIIYVDILKYLVVASVIYILGLWGIILNRQNVIIMLMSIELMLLAVDLNFIFFSVYLDDIIGQLFALLILTVAAAESAIGLAILVSYFRVRGSISVDSICLMRG